MLLRRLGLLALCLVSLQCGSQTPAGPAPVSPTPVVLSPTTPPDPGPSVIPPGGTTEVLVGAGDIGQCTQNAEDTARLLDMIAGTVFTVGDHAYPRGAEPEFRQCYDPTWGRHKARTRPSPGNHDYESPGAAPYFAYFGSAAGPAGLGYYSYNLGAWHVVSLNSNVNIPAQVAWLQNDLDVNRSRCTIAYFHHPLYSSGTHAVNLAVRDLWRVLYRNDAEIVLGGDAHMYERFAPQDHEGQFDLARGIRQFVVGTGGASLQVSRETVPNSEVLIMAFGVLKLTLAPSGYEWEFISVAGTRDTGSGQCH